MKLSTNDPFSHLVIEEWEKKESEWINHEYIDRVVDIYYLLWACWSWEQ